MRVKRTALLAFFTVFCLLSSPLALAIDVDFVAITAGSAREDGIQVEYFISFSVEGFDISTVSVLKPGLPPTLICALAQEGDNDWNCDLGAFASLDDICQTIGFGNFLFDLTAAAGSDDSVTLFFDPGCTDPIAGYPSITAPLPGGTVSPVPGPADFCWDCSSPGTCGSGDTVASLFDMGDTDLAVEILRDLSVPTCWDPGICIPVGPDDEFEVSAVEVYADFEEQLTDLGDDFLYVSAFESANLTLYDVVGPLPTTPPAVPAGVGESIGVEAAKLDSAGSSIGLAWDVESCCGVNDHHLVYGTSADLPSVAGGAFSLDGSVCALGASGTFAWLGVPAPPAGDVLWWVMLANDNATTEGSWGVDGAAQERAGPGAGGASAQCGKTVKDISNACGR